MEGDDFDAMMNRLDELQDSAMDKGEKASDEEKQGAGPKEMYYRGKDIGLAEAKAVIRERIDVERDEPQSTKDENY